jgi:hypothetical protein
MVVAATVLVLIIGSGLAAWFGPGLLGGTHTLASSPSTAATAIDLPSASASQVPPMVSASSSSEATSSGGGNLSSSSSGGVVPPVTHSAVPTATVYTPPGRPTASTQGTATLPSRTTTTSTGGFDPGF